MREFTAEDGIRWRAEVVSHGRTSEYLAAKVHRPIVQFTCLDRMAPRRYTTLEADSSHTLGGLDEPRLRDLLRRAVAH